MRKPVDLSLWLKQGKEFHKAGMSREAANFFKKAIEAKPDYAHAWFLLGALELKLKHHQKAIEALEKAVAYDDKQIGYQAQLLQALQESGENERARLLLQELLPTIEAHPHLLLPLGKICYKLEAFKEGRLLLEKLLASTPNHPSGLNYLGQILQALGEKDQAKSTFQQLIQAHPQLPQPYLNYGHLLRAESKEKEAIQAYQAAIARKAEWWTPYESIIQINMGKRLWPNALDWLKQAEKFSTKEVAFWELAAQTYKGLKQPQRVIASCKKVLEIDENHTNAHLLLGTALGDIGLQAQSMKHFDRVIALAPNHKEGWQMKGRCLAMEKDFAQATECFEKVLLIDPDHLESTIDLAMARANLFQWEHRARDTNQIIGGIERLANQENSGGFVPILSLNYFDISPEWHLKAARLTSKSIENAIPNKYEHKPVAKKKLRIGYLSPDFRQHAVGHLLINFFQHHNREEVEVYAYSLVSPPDDLIQQGIKQEVDAFFDVSQERFDATAARIYQDKIDILVDMGGYTTYTKTDIMAMRPAPIQVQYMGLLDTMGADFINYTLADAHAIPPALAAQYHEKVMHLPCAFIASKSAISAKETDRATWGLPEQGVVFANFNANYKYSPECFRSWMNILREVPQSVLWLTASGSEGRAQLELFAQKEGIEPSRLIFADKVSLPEHLERSQHADLFLDTFIFNAGAVGVSALQAGLPLLTLSGATFASRVGGSLAIAANLPDLVCHSVEEFEHKAIELGQQPEKLQQYKKHLLENELPLFDLKNRAEALEGVYREMWDAYYKVV